MDNKTLLVRCITLLYRENQLQLPETSKELVRKFLENLRLTDSATIASAEKNELMKLKDLCIRMCELPESERIDQVDFVQKLRTICEDDRVFDAIEINIIREMEPAQILSAISQLRREVGSYFKEAEAVKLVREASTTVSFGRDKITNFSRFIGELIDKLEPYSHDSEQKISGLVGYVDIGDTGSLEGAIEEAQKLRNGENAYRTGWQGLNAMLQGGLRPAEEVVCGALQHQFKTGANLTYCRQIIKYNTPKVKKVGAKPLLLRISFEDSLASNFAFLYDAIYFNRHKRMPERTPTKEEMSQVLKDELFQNGWHVKMVRINSSEWTYRDLFNLCLDLESQSYEIKVASIDYLPMLPTTGCEEGPSGHALRDLYRRVRAFFTARDALIITPHQLSTDAKQLVREGTKDFVKKLVGMGYYAGSKQIDQEVDLEIFQHIEKVTVDGQVRAYLTLQRGKHRGMPVIPDSRMYMALPFPEVGPIPDDLEGECISVRRIGNAGLNMDEGYAMEEF